MNESSYFNFQYQLVLQSRRILFDYCRTISNEDFLNQNNSFGRGGSIRNLLVHIANTYEFWIVKHTINKDITFTECSAKNTIEEIIELFYSIDGVFAVFLARHESSMFDLLKMEVNGIMKNIAAFEMFTHVITNEFHHKGQILSLSRHLGYTPIDTDIIR